MMKGNSCSRHASRRRGSVTPKTGRRRRRAREASRDETRLAGLTESIKFVAAKGHLLHPRTIEARNELLLRGVKLPV